MTREVFYIFFLLSLGNPAFYARPRHLRTSRVSLTQRTKLVQAQATVRLALSATCPPMEA